MLKKEVKRMEWGIPEVQPDQRAEAKYLLWITDGVVEEVDWWKSVKPEEPKEEPKKEEEKKVEEEDEEEDEEEEVVETPKKK